MGRLYRNSSPRSHNTIPVPFLEAQYAIFCVVLMAVGEWAILAGPGWATPPTLDGGEWTSPA
jgi:hypothetical protein